MSDAVATNWQYWARLSLIGRVIDNRRFVSKYATKNSHLERARNDESPF